MSVRKSNVYLDEIRLFIDLALPMLILHCDDVRHSVLLFFIFFVYFDVALSLFFQLIRTHTNLH